MAGALQKDFMVDFKRVYKEKGKNDLKAQVPFLSRLANKYRKLGEKDPKEHWTDLLKAHTLYNSCAVRSDVKDRERWMQSSYDIQKLYWGQEVRVTKEQVEKSTAIIKGQLETLRAEMRDIIKPITEEIETWQYSFEVLESSPDAPEIPFPLCEKIQDFSTHCNDSMIDIVQSVIGEAVKFCGEPPCIFSAVAFGSLAKGEATPYSDLEYLFLIEEKSPDNIKYFEKLAVTSYFLVGNVQETSLKYMSIDELRQDRWFVDAAMSGLKIDGLSENAGNIPTGNNQPGTRKNRLILTTSELAEKYKDLLDNPDPNPTHPGDLTDMLTYTREFYNNNSNGIVNGNGNNNLFVTFSGIKSHYFPNERRKQASLQMLQEDIRRYDFVPHERHIFVDSCINLKTDIYRYPSILIYDLKIIYGIEKSNTWEALQSLLDQKVISQELYDSLLFLLCAAQYIRLSAYLDRNSQEDGISILLKDTDADTTVTGKSSWHLPQALFFRICLTMLPVKSHIKTNLHKVNGLGEPVIFKKYEAAIGFYETLQIHQAVIQCIKKQNPCLRDMSLDGKLKLATALAGCLEFFDSIKLLSEILDTLKDNPLTSDAQKFVTDYYGNWDTAIFCITVEKGVRLERCNKTKEALDILNPIASLLVPDHHLRRYYFFLAKIYRYRNETALAAKYHKLSIKDCPSIDGTKLYYRASKLLSRFLHYSENGDYSEAEKTILEALKVTEQLHGEESNHTHIGILCHHLSKLKLRAKKFSEAEKYLDRARRNTDNPTILFEFDVTSAKLMMAQGDYKSACKSLLKLLISQPAIDDKSSAYVVMKTASLELQIGKCYLFSGALKAAEDMLHRAKDLHGRTYVQDGPESLVSTDIAEIGYYIAQCFIGKGQLKEALVAMRQCLDAVSQIIKQASHIPEYFSDMDSSLRSAIRLLRQKGEYADCHLSSARSCFMAFSRIHSTLRNDKLASKYLKEAEKCDIL